jgi:hypothetical protein
LISEFTASDIAATVCAAFRGARRSDEPYVHYLVEGLFPGPVAQALDALPFAAPELSGVSGKRELHNDSRLYFDDGHMAQFPIMRAVAEALQSPAVAATIAEVFKAPVDDTFLRLEYALDIDGFWLEPHTDLGVKKFTCLIYLSDGPGHAELGTDIYAAQDQHWGRSPFIQNTAMVFVPSDRTWHGFEKRPIAGVRRSMILNYVTHEWRAREQLSYPAASVRVSAGAAAR